MTKEQRKNQLRENANTRRQKKRLLIEFIKRFDLAPINVKEESKLNVYLNTKR